jgi:hypothetical protein
MKPSEIRKQIEELQAKLREAEQAERAIVLAYFKEKQALYRFNARELGNYFKPQRTPRK